MEYYYLISGLKVLCQVPFPVNIQEEACEFLFPAEDKRKYIDQETDALVVFQQADLLPEISDHVWYEGDRIYLKTDKKEYVYYCPGPNKQPYACTVWDCDTKKNILITCYYLQGNEFRFGYSRMISDHIGMEKLFIKKDVLMIHAAFIRWNEKGILFTAPSGTGKSTQADLWKKYEQADILNGDRAAVRKANNRWQAYGLPYAGSSGIYRNEHALLAAVIVLRQAKQNRIRRLNALEIVQNVYPELTIHRWDPDFVEQALTLLTELSNEVPFYLLECRPDQEAVELVKHQLTGGD